MFQLHVAVLRPATDQERLSDRVRAANDRLPQGAGLHGLVGTSVMFLKLLGGRVVACTENTVRGEPVEEITSVQRLDDACDAVRDLALNPAESRKFILRMSEESPCEPST